VRRIRPLMRQQPETQTRCADTQTGVR